RAIPPSRNGSPTTRPISWIGPKPVSSSSMNAPRTEQGEDMRHKVAALIKRKPGLTRAEFMDYYERSHAPLARRSFPQIVQYRRNFVDLNGAIFGPNATELDFDSVTEIWYRDRAAYDEMLSTHFQKGVQEVIEADERNFLDQTMTRMIKLEEHGAHHKDADLHPLDRHPGRHRPIQGHGAADGQARPATARIHALVRAPPRAADPL